MTTHDDRVRDYVDTIHAVRARQRWDLLDLARAVMAVADREQATLREERDLIRSMHEASRASARDFWQRVEKAEATIARVEALRDDWPCSDDTCDGDCTGCAYARDLDAALRGPAPTEDRMRGFSMWFDREQWGVIIDGLIQHRGHADARKAANSESTSDVRADMCADLIRQLNAAAALHPTPTEDARSASSG